MLIGIEHYTLDTYCVPSLLLPVTVRSNNVVQGQVWLAAMIVKIQRYALLESKLQPVCYIYSTISSDVYRYGLHFLTIYST